MPHAASPKAAQACDRAALPQKTSKRKKGAGDSALGGAGRLSAPVCPGRPSFEDPSHLLHALAAWGSPQASPEARGFMQPWRPLRQLAPGATAEQVPKLKP